MSKDLDVVLWMTHREYNGKPKLQDTINFVTVNVDLHAEFDCLRHVWYQKDLALF